MIVSNVRRQFGPVQGLHGNPHGLDIGSTDGRWVLAVAVADGPSSPKLWLGEPERVPTLSTAALPVAEQSGRERALAAVGVMQQCAVTGAGNWDRGRHRRRRRRRRRHEHRECDAVLRSRRTLSRPVAKADRRPDGPERSLSGLSAWPLPCASGPGGADGDRRTHRGDRRSRSRWRLQRRTGSIMNLPR